MKTKACEWIIVIVLLIATVLVSSFAILIGTSGGFDSCISEKDTTTTPAEKREVIDHKPVSVERQVYDILIKEGISNAGACGVLANAKAESDLQPDNLENLYNRKFSISDAEYTELADKGKIDFVHDAAGYGLWQFTYYEFKQVLLDTANDDSTSISDVETQVKALVKILKTPEFSKLFKLLKETEDIEVASIEFMLVFERPANTGESAKATRVAFANEFYKNFNK